MAGSCQAFILTVFDRVSWARGGIASKNFERKIFLVRTAETPPRHSSPSQATQLITDRTDRNLLFARPPILSAARVKYKFVRNVATSLSHVGVDAKLRRYLVPFPV